MVSLQEKIDKFQEENKSDIKHHYAVNGSNGYYTLGKYDKKGEKLEDISTSPTFTKRKGVRTGSLQACYYAWLIIKYR